MISKLLFYLIIVEVQADRTLAALFSGGDRTVSNLDCDEQNPGINYVTGGVLTVAFESKISFGLHSLRMRIFSHTFYTLPSIEGYRMNIKEKQKMCGFGCYTKTHFTSQVKEN